MFKFDFLQSRKNPVEIAYRSDIDHAGLKTVMGVLADGRMPGQHSQPIKINRSSQMTIWPTILLYTALLDSYLFVGVKESARAFLLQLFRYSVGLGTTMK